VYSQDAPNLISKFIILLILALLAAIIAVTFILADYIAKAVGEVGIVVITKIMGLVVTAIAFEMIIAGLQTVMPMILKGSS
jgi:multiple antibiotic resistance protein